MFFGFEKVQKFIKTGLTKLFNKKLPKNYKDDVKKAEKIKFYSYYEFYSHKIIALYEYQLHLIAGVDKDEPNFEKLQNECKYYDNLCGSIDLKSVCDQVKLACIDEPKFQELMKSINYYNYLIKHFVNHYNSDNYAQNIEYWEDFYYERLCEYCENSAKYRTNGVDDIRREIIEFANRELTISVRDGVLDSTFHSERQNDQEILRQAQHDNFNEHDAPLGCHPERSEGSQNDQEMLRFAQHDKKQSQHDKNVDNTSSYVQDHRARFAATPPREGNYDFPYLSDSYNEYANINVVCANDNEILPPHQVRGQNDNFNDLHDAPLGCHPERSEGSQNDQEMLRFAQHDKKQSQHDKNVDNTSSYVQDHRARFAATPPLTGNYDFPYLSNVYNGNRHSCEGRNLDNKTEWIPAFAGMTATPLTLIECITANDNNEILPPHQVRGQNDNFNKHDAPLGCHPERSEGSYNKTIYNKSIYVQDHRARFAATPPQEGNYDFPYLSDVYNEYDIINVVCANDDSEILRFAQNDKRQAQNDKFKAQHDNFNAKNEWLHHTNHINQRRTA